MINFEALFKISYGLYIVSSGNKNEGNGFISNTVFQVTSYPARFAVCCNKNNYTTLFLGKYETFSVSILHKNTSADIFGRFGYKSGKDFDKLSGMQIKYGESDVPIILNDCIAFLVCKVVQIVDLGTHMMFIGELTQAEFFDESKEPLTYQYYREVKKGSAPKNAPTYIDKSKFSKKETSYKKYKCPVCGFIYDEANETVKFKDLPINWICPVCGCEKSEFIEF
jgi:flavin reductase (DIM6/NTAB) family NADH-FMN oxidoreductase RutF/rubredoxin